MHVQGPVAVGGAVTQSGEYVAGHTLIHDQSVHTTGLLAGLISRPQVGPTAEELRRARSDLLDQVDLVWVQELNRSLDALARIELGLAERSTAVDSPARAILRRPPEPDRPLGRGVTVTTVFRSFGRQLLILGEPGAGKTSLLLDITRDLLAEARREAGEPMPVVFHLASWTVERLPLAEWLLRELQRRYLVPRRLARTWLNGDHIIPLLDGLDEVAAEHRDACVEAINAFHSTHGHLPMAICCRVQEYEALQARLQLRAAVIVQPLSRADVDAYLEQAGGPMARVHATLRDDEQLGELLTTPLVLSIVCLTYPGRPITAATAHETLDERRRHIFADYVDAMLRRPRPASRAQVHQDEDMLRWLATLARQLQNHGQSVFSLDWMQPELLPTGWQRWSATIGLSVAISLLSAAAIGLDAGLVFASTGTVAFLPSGAVIIAGFGLATAVAIGLAIPDATVVPAERLHWSWPVLRRDLPRWVLAGLLFGLPVGLVGGVVAGLAARADGIIHGAAVGIAVGLVAGVAVGLFFGLTGCLQAQPQVDPARPGTAIRTAGRNGLVAGLVSGLAGATLSGFGVGAVIRLAEQLPSLHIRVGSGLVGGAIAGIGIGLGGRALGLRGGAVGRWRSVPFVALAAGLCGCMAGGVTSAHFDPLVGGIATAAVIAPGAALVVGMQRGGAAYLRHHAIRLLLAWGRAAPRNYAAFLDEATRLILLRRRGGAHQFPHRLLQDYFANLELTRDDAHRAS